MAIMIGVCLLLSVSLGREIIQLTSPEKPEYLPQSSSHTLIPAEKGEKGAPESLLFSSWIRFLDPLYQQVTVIVVEEGQR